MQPDKRNHLIDLLRILAASWVVFFHLNQPIKPIDNWYRNFCKYGHLGVPVFFIISGYCILIALHHAKKPTEFAVRRFFRIFPPYWFSLAITAVIILLLKFTTSVNSVAVIPKNITGIVATLTLTTTPITDIKTINWVYWTLSYEVFFYLAVFACAFFKKQYFVIALTVVTLLSIVLPRFESGPLFFLNLWPLFSLGVALYQLLHQPAYKWFNIALLAFTTVDFYATHQSYIYIVLCLITGALIVINHFKPLKSNLLSHYGDVSYSLYLAHVPIGIYLLGHLKTTAIQTNVALNIVFDVAILISLVFISGLMHRYIELPAIKYGKRFGK
jgi:peptidoglycan/LPS O-acetylase OafA/YrhL